MNDDDLLDALTAAFAIPPVEPSAQGLRSLHDAVRATSAFRRRRRWAVPAIAGVGVIAMSGVAAAAGVPLPRVVRQVGHTIGLPVDSPQLLDARRHRRALQAALNDGELTTARREADDLRAGLADLDDDERGKIEPGAEPLLQQADEQAGAGQGGDAQDDKPGNSGARGTTPGHAGANGNKPGGPAQSNQDDAPGDGPSTDAPAAGDTETDPDDSRASITQPKDDTDSTGATDDNR